MTVTGCFDSSSGSRSPVGVVAPPASYCDFEVSSGSSGLPAFDEGAEAGAETGVSAESANA